MKWNICFIQYLYKIYMFYTTVKSSQGWRKIEDLELVLELVLVLVLEFRIENWEWKGKGKGKGNRLSL